MENKQSLQEKIASICIAAELSQADRDFWLDKLSVSDERVQSVFVNIFADDIDLLRTSTRQLRGRVSAGDDSEKLAAALENEREYFRAFLAQAKTQ